MCIKQGKDLKVGHDELCKRCITRMEKVVPLKKRKKKQKSRARRFSSSTFDQFPHQSPPRSPQPRFSKTIYRMDLSLMMNSQEDHQEERRNGPRAVAAGTSNNINPLVPIEKEHMFDKVVTPSDVGKLNRLVIHKQHAEKFFPLDASSNEKGLLLNFEDRNGKPWRFRYSYWNSSQSYVMTKGWSRFVKEKKLDAGDIVSFQRGVGESHRGRLFIDYRHRPELSRPRSEFVHMNYPPQWGSVCTFPHPIQRNYCMSFANSHHGHIRTFPNHQGQVIFGYDGSAGGSHMRSPMEPSITNPIYDHNLAAPLVFDSVPIVPGKNMAVAGKRLRLFGVNMECADPDQDRESSSSSGRITPRGTVGTANCILPSSPFRLRLSDNAQLEDEDQYAKKGKSSLSFGLDL